MDKKTNLRDSPAYQLGAFEFTYESLRETTVCNFWRWRALKSAEFGSRAYNESQASYEIYLATRWHAKALKTHLANFRRLVKGGAS